MKIVLLGTGSTLPHKDRNAAGILIQVHDSYLLFDCGNGILRQIERANIDFTQINTIFISHLHADHVNDFPVLLKADIMSNKANKIKIFGPSALKKTMKGWFKDVYPYLDKVLDLIDIQEITGDWIETPEWKIRGFPVQHVGVAYGFKLEAAGKTVIYSGDTGYCEELIQAAKNADLLIHECSYPTEFGEAEAHTNPLELGQIAKQANVKQVVLTHFYPACSGREEEMMTDVKSLYKGKVTIGEDLLEIILE
jgi:ribonuclease BN (tRNA processing enzyme)